MYRFSFRRISEHTAELRFGWFWRIIFILIALLFIAVSVSEGSFVIPSLILASASLASALYTERWHFDVSGEKTLTSYVGLWPLFRVRRLSLSGIKAVTVRAPSSRIEKHLARHAWSSGGERMGNILDRRIARVLLEKEDDSPIMLYTETSRKLDDMSMLAKELADFLEIPYSLTSDY